MIRLVAAAAVTLIAIAGPARAQKTPESLSIQIGDAPALVAISSAKTGCRFKFTVAAPADATKARLRRDGVFSGGADTTPFAFERTWPPGAYQVSADVVTPSGTLTTPALPVTCP